MHHVHLLITATERSGTFPPSHVVLIIYLLLGFVVALRCIIRALWVDWSLGTCQLVLLSLAANHMEDMLLSCHSTAVTQGSHRIHIGVSLLRALSLLATGCCCVCGVQLLELAVVGSTIILLESTVITNRFATHPLIELRVEGVISVHKNHVLLY